ncbi:MAG: hypothetical protein PHV05_12835 [Candidatus Riflebacteria bacterium]|nr:hypothetical protein [Candidatus Riflebacteria bacterium]
MKTSIKIAILVLLIAISVSAFASFSGHYLCVRRNGATYKHRLYTTTAEVGSPRMATRVGGTTYYAKMFSGELAGLFLKAKHSGVSYQILEHMLKKTATYGNGAGTGSGQFSLACCIAFDSSGNFYVTDLSLDRVQKFDSSGSYVTKWGSTGTGNGYFNEPRGIAVDSDGYVYVVDGLNDRLQVFTSSGSFVRVIGSSGSTDGKFQNPFGIAIQGSNLVVQDSDGRIQWFTKTGSFVKKNTPSTSGTLAICVEPTTNNLYVTNGTRVIKCDPNGYYATSWACTAPYGVAADGMGNVFVVSYASSGDLLQYSDSGVSKASHKWLYSPSSLSYPYGLALGIDGNIYATAQTYINKFE